MSCVMTDLAASAGRKSMKSKKTCSNEFEIQAWENGHLVLGIDEAGRGPIAGPLCVAGVVFPYGYQNEDIYDSKALSEKKRESLFDVILKDALSVKILIVSEQEIDEKNIYRATQHAMHQIASELECDEVLTDAMPLPDYTKHPVQDLVKGDQKSISIAAASILAKVTRDRIMNELDEKYPGYGFAKHKGYPTAAHVKALNELGVLPVHRRSYRPVYQALHSQMMLDLGE